MPSRGSRHHRHQRMKLWKSDNIISQLWDSFWDPPSETCPKCGRDVVEYYDPFFFSPIRTLRGKRRVKCLNCRFIWRPKKTVSSVWDKIIPRH